MTVSAVAISGTGVPPVHGRDALATESTGQRPVQSAAFSSFFGDAGAAASDPEQARESAEEFVAVAFIQPVLKSLRESNNAAEPFKPGPAERAFQPMLDAQIAQRIVERQDYDLVDAVTRQMLQRAPESNEQQMDRRRPAEVDVNA